MTFWHGGPKIPGDLILPPADHGRARVCHGDPFVYLATERGLALNYAVTCNGWLYEVEPIGVVEQDPDSILGPGVSVRCSRARILRRFKPSRQETEARRFLIDAIELQRRFVPDATYGAVWR